MQTNKFNFLLVGVLCALSLVGCMEKDLYEAPKEKTADNYFGFTTSSSCTVDLNYGLNYQVVFELYAENPLSEPIRKGFSMISYPFRLILQNFTSIQIIWEQSVRFSCRL